MAQLHSRAGRQRLGQQQAVQGAAVRARQALWRRPQRPARQSPLRA